MNSTRRELLGGAAATALVSLAASVPGTAFAQAGSDDFDIDAVFAAFMRDIGGTPADGGGTVTFTGARSDRAEPLPHRPGDGDRGDGGRRRRRRHLAQRTGEGQDLTVDLRKSVYNVNPLIGLILRQTARRRHFDLTTRCPARSASCRRQRPLAPGAARSWQSDDLRALRDEDGRFVTPTGLIRI